MKTFHILPKTAHMSDAFNSTHYIDLPNGQILLSGEFRDRSQEIRFKAQAGVQSLPHPMSGGKVNLAKEQADYLNSLGAKIQGNEAVYDFCELLCTIHGGMGVC
jgi:hypothetical protein